MPPAAAGSPFAAHWDLDPEVVFLNHGSFGACPRVALEHQRELQRRLEREPVLFLHRELERRLDEARAALAPVLGCDPDDFAFVPNATAGVATVLRSLDLAPGDELVLTDHEYNACKNAAEYKAQRAGARVVTAAIPFPIREPRQVTDAVLAALTPRTKLVLIDHVTSPTGIVLPVADVVRGCAEHGVDVLIDGAHAPGMLPLDLDALGAAFWTGNCHKWLCAPKGSAVLHVRRDRQLAIRPLAISHGANSPRTDRSRFRLEFDFTGTCDPTPWLATPAAVRFLSSLLPGGLAAVQQHNRSLAIAGRKVLCDALRVPPPAPESMLGSLASVPLPLTSEPPLPPHGLDPLQAFLWERHRIEVPVMRWPKPELRLLRISPQLYNALPQYELLARAAAEGLAAAPSGANRA